MSQPLLRSSPLARTGGARLGLAPGRLKSLDALRGLTIATMILVDNAGGAFPAIDHSPWDGVTLADLVMPTFDWIVGVSVVLSLSRFTSAARGSAVPPAAAAAFVPSSINAAGDGRPRLYNFPKVTDDALSTARVLQKVLVRFAKLFVLGVATQGGVGLFEYDLQHIRVMGILQRVAVCFLVAALCEVLLPTLRCANVFAKYALHWAVAAALVAAHSAIMYGLHVPGCGRGVLTPRCNAQSLVDQRVLGIEHMYFPWNGGDPTGRDLTTQRMPECSVCSPGKCAPPLGWNVSSSVQFAPWCDPVCVAGKFCHGAFDPEGLVSSLTASVAPIFGMHAAHVFQMERSHSKRLLHWGTMAAAQLVVGVALDRANLIRANTDLYSISFLLITSGVSTALLCLAYLACDCDFAEAEPIQSTVAGRRRQVTNPTICSRIFMRPQSPFVWLGRNSIAIYVLAEGGILQWPCSWFWWGFSDRSLANLLWPTGAIWGDRTSCPAAFGQPGSTRPAEHASHNIHVLVWTLGYILLMIIIARVLDARGIYFKI